MFKKIRSGAVFVAFLALLALVPTSAEAAEWDVVNDLKSLGDASVHDRVTPGGGNEFGAAVDINTKSRIDGETTVDTFGLLNHGSVFISDSKVTGTTTITTDARSTSVRVDTASAADVASVQIDDSEIQGDLDVVLVAITGALEVTNASILRIGSFSMRHSSSKGNVKIRTDVVTGPVTISNGSVGNLGNVGI